MFSFKLPKPIEQAKNSYLEQVRNKYKEFQEFQRKVSQINRNLGTEPYVWFDIEVYNDKCNFGVAVTPRINPLGLPTPKFIWRNNSAECGLSAIAPPPITETDPPYVPPPEATGIYIFINQGSIISEQRFNDGQSEKKQEHTWTSKFINAKYPKSFGSIYGQVEMDYHYFLKNDVSWQSGDELGNNYGGTYTVDFYDKNKFHDFFVSEDQIIGMAVFGYANALLYAQNSGRNVKITSYTQQNFYDYTYLKKQITWTVYEIGASPKKQPPPPPPPLDITRPERQKEMCCPDQTNLLKLILKRIGPVPATVPASLAKPGSGTKNIESLAEFISYTVKQLDALIGKYPLQIAVEDTDLTQEGNQSKTITLPNMAEAMAEIVGLLLVLRSESNANLIATINAMIEAGSAKQAASLAVDYAKGNAEYLGYKGKQVEHKLPFTFKPGEQRLDKMLKSGELSVKGFENTDEQDLNDQLVPLLEMAAMYRAANFRNLGTSDPLGKLRSVLKGAANLSGAIDHLVNTPPPQDPENPKPVEPKKNDWDIFLEQAEQGFIAQSGITDPTNPYGRPLDQRPKIREIGNDTSDTQ